MKESMIDRIIVGNEYRSEDGKTTGRDYKVVFIGEQKAMYVRVRDGRERHIQVIPQTGLLRAKEFIGSLDTDIMEVVRWSTQGCEEVEKDKRGVQDNNNGGEKKVMIVGLVDNEKERVERAKRLSNSKKADYKIAKLVKLEKSDEEVAHIANKIKTRVMRYDLANIKNDYTELVKGRNKDEVVTRIIGESNRECLTGGTDDIASYIVSIIRYRIAKKNDIGIKEDVKIDAVIEQYCK